MGMGLSMGLGLGSSKVKPPTIYDYLDLVHAYDGEEFTGYSINKFWYMGEHGNLPAMLKPVIPLGVDGNYKIISIAIEAFKDAPIQSIAFNEDSVIHFNNQAFEGCIVLTSIIIPADIDTGAFVFNGCTSLVYADVSKLFSESEFPSIGRGLFFGCPLTTIIIGRRTKIYDEAGTMGTNGNFRTDYIASGEAAGTYIWNGVNRWELQGA